MGKGKLTRRGADGLLREIGELDVAISSAEEEMAREISAVKGRYEKDLAGLRRKRARREGRLLDGCRDARADLFDGENQTLSLGFGRVSFRAKPPKVEVGEGLSQDEVIGKLPAKMERFVRVRKSLDKTGLRAAVLDGELTVARLERSGMRWVEGEEVWIVEPDLKAARGRVGQA